MHHLAKLLGFFVLVTVQVFPFQEQGRLNRKIEKISVVPGPEYEAGWLHRFFFGSNWRNLWTTPVSAEVLDLDQFAGGLVPTKKGGGKQTRNLRLKGKDGREYKFRSIDKDPRQSLPENLQGSLAGDFLQDQISSANPVVSVIVAPLLNAVGVLNAEPSIVIMPNDARLGEYQSEFGGLLGTIEKSPKETGDEEENFGGAQKFTSTYKLFHRLEDDNNEQVDAIEFLKARLMDIYIGDWDRHADQWRWAGFQQDSMWVWKPIPRDRDWAFCRFQGLVPWFAEQAVPELKGFSEDYPDIEFLTWKGRHLDRRLLVSVDKLAWDSVTVFIVSNLTDSVIENAVQRCPPEMYSIEGPALERALKLRRSRLQQASDEFYRLTSRFPDVRGSDKPEFAHISYLDDHRVRISLYRRDRKSGEKIGAPFFERTFSDEYTKDIRVYLLGGNDRAVIDGRGKSDIEVRVIGGRGEDELTDQSKGEVFFYDSDAGTILATTTRTEVNRNVEEEPTYESERYEPRFRDYGHGWKSSPWFTLTPDYGILVGGGPILYDYGFRAHPSVFRMQLLGGVTTSALRFRLDYNAEFFSLIKRARILVHLRASQIESQNFFGYGNESPSTSELKNADYYKVYQQHLIVEPSVDFLLHKNFSVTVGARLKYVTTDLKSGTLLQLLRPLGSQKNLMLMSLSGRVNLDTRDIVSAATRGQLLDIQGFYVPNIIDIKRPFGKLEIDGRTYFSVQFVTETTVALRIAGEKLWGQQIPFFESAFLGGANTVRGYDAQRFAGNSSLYGNAELRFFVCKFSFLVPGRFGLHVFTDAGKVFASGETSHLWHSSVGGGLWFSFISSQYTMSISVARSKERTGFYVLGGFMF